MLKWAIKYLRHPPKMVMEWIKMNQTSIYFKKKECLCADHSQEIRQIEISCLRIDKTIKSCLKVVLTKMKIKRKGNQWTNRSR